MPSTPDQIYGPLFTAIQLSDVYEDSKTFVDLVPKDEPQVILSAYLTESKHLDFDLAAFVDKYFKTEKKPVISHKDQVSIDQHIESLWTTLQRPPDNRTSSGSSKIALPESYIVPGGRFNEIYYWDSYFTMVGLVRAGKIDLALGMLRNFTYLIETYGHVPNGNRTYFLSRSQPPFYSLMYTLLQEHLSQEDIRRSVAAMAMEYRFWMAGAAQLREDGGHHRRVVLTGGHLVSRYYDDSPTPRQESYKEDVHDAQGLDNKAAFYRHIRAACESGWDFSSRWFAIEDDISSIRTCDIVPIDLNCLLWHLEVTLSQHASDEDRRTAYSQLADKRSAAIQALCWQEEDGYFGDYLHTEASGTGRLTAAMVFPLYFGLATPSQAEQVASVITDHLIKPGGLMTTINHTRQQWDAPNGWAPLQYMAVYGLDRYDLHEVARSIATGWCTACESKYAQDKKLIEKYNVIDPLHTAEGGEYPAQDGFGWTNAVYIDLKHYLDPQC